MTEPSAPNAGRFRCPVSVSLPLDGPPRPLRGSGGGPVSRVSPRTRQSPSAIGRCVTSGLRGANVLQGSPGGALSPSRPSSRRSRSQSNRGAKNRLFHGDRLDLDEQGRRGESLHASRGDRRRRQQTRARLHETFQQTFVGQEYRELDDVLLHAYAGRFVRGLLRGFTLFTSPISRHAKSTYVSQGSWQGPRANLAKASATLVRHASDRKNRLRSQERSVVP